MIKFRFSGLISVLLLLLFQKGIAQKQDFRFVEQGLHALNEVLIHDITSPPVASRNYVYPLIAFYEAVRPGYEGYKTYAGQLNGLTSLPEISPALQYDWLVAGTTAFYKTSYGLVFSKELFQQFWDSIDVEIRKRPVPKEVYERSVTFGEQVAVHILKWAREDNLAHIRTLPRFTPGRQPGTWQQTAPDYMEAVEPYWNQMRPMTLSKPDQFLLPVPTVYKSDNFLKECKEVFETGNKLSKEQTRIADFWDCNPFATQTVGHLMYSVKKISPAGHWIGITGVVIKERKQNLIEALYSYSLVSVAIFDAIIACWDEKFNSNYIRPVTAIQQLISPVWQPHLQTPPFPEYPSGHSVISNASAVILTSIYGEKFRYVDDVETPYGLPKRTFNSFYGAANEAAISRLYGGIHFREAIENGKDLGKNIAYHVLEKIILTTDRKEK
jgi:PAP2 superfamily